MTLYTIPSTQSFHSHTSLRFYGLFVLKSEYHRGITLLSVFVCICTWKVLQAGWAFWDGYKPLDTRQCYVMLVLKHFFLFFFHYVRMSFSWLALIDVTSTLCSDLVEPYKQNPKRSFNWNRGRKSTLNTLPVPVNVPYRRKLQNWRYLANITANAYVYNRVYRISTLQRNRKRTILSNQ